MTRLPLLLGACLLAACGTPSAPLLDRPAVFGREVVWAQGTTLHAGSETFEVPGQAQRVWPTPYGFLLQLGAGPVVLFDGQQSTPLPGEQRTVHVSPDGRFAGWIDDGPERSRADRLAAAVVVDLRTGAAVLRDDDGMGDESDDLADLYEDGEPTFLGFDDTAAYWRVVKGRALQRRAELPTADGGPSARRPGRSEQRAGTPYDLLIGRGRTGGGVSGIVSPDGHWCVTVGERGTLPVEDCRTSASVTPRYPAPDVRFGGWVDDDSYAVLARAGQPEPRPLGPDRTTGVIAVCDLPSGACTTTAEVTETDSVVFGVGGPGPLL